MAVLHKKEPRPDPTRPFWVQNGGVRHVKPLVFSAWLRKRAWALALAGTVFGIAVVLPAADGFGWWVIPVAIGGWLITFLTLRFCARVLPGMFFPNET
jgi:hypothetical protein